MDEPKCTIRNPNLPDAAVAANTPWTALLRQNRSPRIGCDEAPASNSFSPGRIISKNSLQRYLFDNFQSVSIQADHPAGTLGKQPNLSQSKCS